MVEKVYKPLEIKTADVCALPSNETTKGFWFCDLLPLLNGDMDEAL